MNHSFDIEHARLYGIPEAIMIQNLQFWIEKNRANCRHLYDDRTWTYNSVKAFAELFPYMTASAVRRALTSLQDHGVIVSGNYNASQYDRTTWFAFADEAVWLSDISHLSKTANAFVKNSKCIVQKPQMDLAKSANGFVENSNSDTDIKPVVKTDEVSALPTATPPAVAEKPKVDPELQEACRATWDAYAKQYEAKYSVQPVRNAKVNAAIKAFVIRLGYIESAPVAEFFVDRIDEVMVVRAMHDVGLLLKNAEAYRTQWATGRTSPSINSETAYQRSMRLRVAEISPSLARPAPGQPDQDATAYFQTIPAIEVNK